MTSPRFPIVLFEQLLLKVPTPPPTESLVPLAVPLVHVPEFVHVVPLSPSMLPTALVSAVTLMDESALLG